MLDLLRDEKGHPRRIISAAKPVGSAATAACHLNLRLVATSRFVHEFAPDTRAAPTGEPGKFEVHTRSPSQSPVGKVLHEYVMTVNATVRPPPPVVTRTELVAPEHRSGAPDRIWVSKRFSLRLYFDSTIRASEPDELIAVLIAPADSIKERKYDIDAGVPPLLPWDPSNDLAREFADEIARYPVEPVDPALKEALHYATRWGADPTALPTGRLESLISPVRFSGNVAAYPNKPLPVNSAAPGSIKVDVILYKPQLDPNNGEWYVDIGIDSGGAHAPFVRLALARYKPFALNDSLELSTPVLLDPVRIPAPRLVEISRGPHQKIQVKVVGAGYSKRAPAGTSDTVRHLTDVALQDMALMRAVGKARGEWLPVFDAQGRTQHIERAQPDTLGPLHCWTGSFDPPPGRGAERYAVVINEVDMHLPDAFLDGQPPAAPKDAQPADLVPRPGFFSVTVSIGDDNDG
jgi:hypothetical protein